MRWCNTIQQPPPPPPPRSPLRLSLPPPPVPALLFPVPVLQQVILKKGDTLRALTDVLASTVVDIQLLPTQSGGGEGGVCITLRGEL